jgi:hypothetical protein
MKNSLNKGTEFVKIYLYAIVHNWFKCLANLKPMNEDLLLIVLVNVVHERSSTYFILFALPKITVRADVIEFTDRETRVKLQDTENIR